MSAPDTNTRLISIESLLLQLQYDLEQLNSALRSQQGEIEDLRNELHRVSAALEEQSQDPIGPADEPPPHY